MKFTIVSCSLSEESRSRTIARRAEQMLADAGNAVSFVDLRQEPLPQFDNGSSFKNPIFSKIHSLIDECDGVVLASPIYNWGLSSAVKNLIELTGATGEDGRQAAWFDKVVTFLCSGGLPHSYMAYGPLALSLMLDFKCVINPYTVYATDRDFTEMGHMGDRILSRLGKTMTVHIELCGSLQQRTYRSTWEV
ncbi:NADPH-dependent FMN reductase [Pseudotabrizicola sp. 4114]|uniref:NADPH-dependent FMN reductase n=1 Tax=Pseudotabrizicola sp. 4114 TaxID=2817731 RepID=UPI0028551E25|nr:FMN reductase [Pseudorhodobacter sp. 4114]